ncbi:hypothetical protein RI129_004700 [Pyrocoelia pectoralis]|uniref:Dihydrolipoamide acetyltransferase component of pyruvate dehydrogenase complex n=1 Tax=Pyrocoelia pectoralis TaxID=417401 RepID=A0AAN7ZR82_9COLE
MSAAIKCHKLLNVLLNKSVDNTRTLNKYLKARNIHTSREFWAKVSFNLTDIGEGIREVALKEWFVKVGDKVSQFDNICEVQSDKASVTITSRYDGVITKLYYDVDGIAYVGKPLLDIETDQVEETSKNEVQVQKDVADKIIKKEEHSTVSINDEVKLCIPSVRRMAKQYNVNLSLVQGTGKDGSILKEDILNYLEKVGKSEEKVPEIIPPTAQDRVEPIRGFKRAMVKTMTESLKIPHLVYCDEIAITQLSKIRKSLKKEAEYSGVKLTMLAFFIKSISNALHKYPILNSSLDGTCENIIYKAAHNIGVAMDTEVGLAVPVIKNVQQLNILQIAKEINRLSQSRKDGRFTTDDLSGGTFTVSNVGAIGGTYASPVIAAPQVAIIAIGESKIYPRFDSNGNVIAEEIINVSASADHRIIDGSTIANFVNLVKKQLQNPYTLFIY